MRNLIILLVMIVALFLGTSTNSGSNSTLKPIYDYKVTVTQINSQWNEFNSLPIERLKNCEVRFAYMEDQPQHIQEKYSKIPIIAISIDNKIIKLWEGDIMFQPTTTLSEIQSVVDTLK